MTDNTAEDDGAEEQREPTAEVYLEDADDLMYESLVEEFGEELISADLREVVKERVRQLYDNRDAVAQQLAQAQQQAALAGQ